MIKFRVPLRMLSEWEGHVLGSNEGSLGDDIEEEFAMLLLREQRHHETDDHEHELSIYRSESAPPTVEGSLSAVGGFFCGSGGDDGSWSRFNEFSVAKDRNGFVSEEELRSDPDYLSYYYSNVNLNPRLPPPLLSKEDWRFTQRLKGGGSSTIGGLGYWRKVSRPENGCARRPPFSMPPGFDLTNQEIDPEPDEVHRSADWAGDGQIGLCGLGLGSKQKSLAEIFQDDLGRASPVIRPPSRPVSLIAFNENPESMGHADTDPNNVGSGLTSPETLQGGSNDQVLSSSVQKPAQQSSYTYAAALGASLSGRTTPEPQVIARAPNPCLAPIGGGRVEKKSVVPIASTTNSLHSTSSMNKDLSDVVTALSGMKVSYNEDHGLLPDDRIVLDSHEDYLFNIHGRQNPVESHNLLKEANVGPFKMPSVKSSGVGAHTQKSSLLANRPPDMQKSKNSYWKGSPTSTLSGGGGSNMSSQCQHMDASDSSYPNYQLSGFSMDPSMALMMAGQIGTGNLPHLYENFTASSAMAIPGMESCLHGFGGGALALSGPEPSAFAGMPNQLLGGGSLQASLMDHNQFQYLRTQNYAAQLAALSVPSPDRNYSETNYMNLIELQKAYLEAMQSHQKPQYSVPVGGKLGYLNHHNSYYRNIYPVRHVGGGILPNSHVRTGSPVRQSEFMRFPSGVGNLTPWHLDAGFGMEQGFASSRLEEFKSNKTRFFELSDISGHIVEFCADQYGSRFIQQKLETATTEEKNMVYQEIMPKALSLMTDVFGNYVIQKFFDQGLAPQRRELANDILGHVLTLSLQMYGCRVIQKAIEVIDMDQKIKMVQELDGHVMRCVRDQNGNHVIQKCIECVPEDAINFIVSTFFDQVVTLSTHPYGCRVIQRVLEQCKDPKTQEKVMDEILGAVSLLAQDQYGNYVIQQHVLEHGKPGERSSIIEELAGKIVQMSQQKFASNVVEKCLTFGGPAERQLLVNEMLGTTDENEPLQAMVKDQFANYVVQKVLETCDDHQRELILSRIKAHLNALKRYTYGKHIVARVEKLVAAGESRIAAQSLQPA
ncbi:hypothetical protein SAY86_031954 [Trapa natans]|uniref:PUM-HD domain-containing protein n=1 Tax=Trapa natans TaxID=22666 RepID=A0AAN7M7Z7_TRANT|nr:hypothetical protein SAY86_031954 [Trapa natans]